MQSIQAELNYTRSWKSISQSTSKYLFLQFFSFSRRRRRCVLISLQNAERDDEKEEEGRKQRRRETTQSDSIMDKFN